MRRPTWLAVVALALAGTLGGWSAFGEKLPTREFLPRGPTDPMLNPALPFVTIQSGDTVWVNVHTTDMCPGDPRRGGEATGGPDGYETWCFEEGPQDTVSTGPGGTIHTFRQYDRRTYRNGVDSLYWHATTFQAITPGNMCMWCGGFNDRCGGWTLTTGGYGNYWNQVMQLELGPLSVAHGCSVQFKTRYIMECDYDYAHLEFYSFRANMWKALDSFNGKSDCSGFFQRCLRDWNNYPGHDKCLPLPWGQPVDYPGHWRGQDLAPRVHPEYPYSEGAQFVIIPGDSISATPGNTTIRLRWRMLTDMAGSAEDGYTHMKGIWIDDVVVKWDGTPPLNTLSESFDLVSEGGLPGYPWSFPHLDPIYEGWAIRYDLDPPFEGYFLPNPGDSGIPSACDVNASWQWSITPTGVLIPPPYPGSSLPGYHIVMMTPAIPLNYSDEEGGPFPNPGVVYQSDQYMNMIAVTCDYTDTWVRVHLASAPPPYTNGAWCEWITIDGLIETGGGTFWNTDLNEDVTAWTVVPGADSVQYGLVSLDVGQTGDSCWEPTLPPHRDSQFVVDNISVGIMDGTATTFTISAISGRFQDTFNVHTCMHTPNVANNDLRYDRYLLHDQAESLNVTIMDPDGLTPGNVELRYSYDGGQTWEPSVAMNLSVPDPTDPSSGGIWRTTICDTPWTPGTEILYYVYAQDDAENGAYYPSQSDPTHPSYPQFLEVSILPSPGSRVLFVDDFGRARRDYHPCRQETTTRAVEDFYELVLQDLGYGYMQPGGYDKYDVGSASSNQRINEPYGFWYADPDTPDVGMRAYDIVIWTTGPYFASNTIQDTTQIFLKQFVFNGGNIWITGDRIGQDLSDPSTSVDPEFYPYVLGAGFQGTHPSAFLDSERFPKVPAGGVNTYLPVGDSLHLYTACDIVRQPMDKITLISGERPEWSHPGAYLIYEDMSAPYDSLAGIYNFVTFGADTGRVVYTPFSLEAVVDSTTTSCDPPPGTDTGLLADIGYGTFHGRAELVADVLRFFGENPTVPPASVGPGVVARYVNALHPVQPNPFNPETALSFELAARERVKFTVYDVQGRLVRTLLDEVRDAGSHQVRWDGRNGAGHPVASGIYFARLELAGFTAAEKMTLLR